MSTPATPAEIEAILKLARQYGATLIERNDTGSVRVTLGPDPSAPEGKGGSNYREAMERLRLGATNRISSPDPRNIDPRTAGRHGVGG